MSLHTLKRKSQTMYYKTHSLNSGFSINNSRRSCADPLNLGRPSVISNQSYLTHKKKGYVKSLYGVTPENGCSILYPNTVVKSIEQTTYQDKLDKAKSCNFKVATNSSMPECPGNIHNNYVKEVGSMDASTYTEQALKKKKNLAPPCPIEPVMKRNTCS